MSRLTRDDIIAGAGRRFATHGYHGTSMRDLGDDLGILGSSIYAHVGGKQELLVAVIERGASYFAASAEAAVADADSPSDRLTRLIAGHIDVVLTHRSEARTYLSETDFLPDEDRLRIAASRDSYEQAFVDAIEDGIGAGEFDPDRSARLSAIYVLSVLNAVDRWFDDDGRLDRAGLAEDISAFVTRGVMGTG